MSVGVKHVIRAWHVQVLGFLRNIFPPVGSAFWWGPDSRVTVSWAYSAFALFCPEPRVGAASAP